MSYYISIVYTYVQSLLFISRFKNICTLAYLLYVMFKYDLFNMDRSRSLICIYMKLLLKYIVCLEINKKLINEYTWILYEINTIQLVIHFIFFKNLIISYLSKIL